MKKGFTLIELLAVITIIGIIAVIAVPNVMNVFTDKKGELYNSTVDELKRVTSIYLVNNPTLYETISNAGYIDVNITTLCTNKYITCPILDPRDSSEITGYVRITSSGDDYTYSFTRSN